MARLAGDRCTLAGFPTGTRIRLGKRIGTVEPANALFYDTQPLMINVRLDATTRYPEKHAIVDWRYLVVVA